MLTDGSLTKDVFLQDCMAFLCGPANSGLWKCRVVPSVRAAAPEVGLEPGVMCEDSQQINIVPFNSN